MEPSPEVLAFSFPDNVQDVRDVSNLKDKQGLDGEAWF